MTEPYIIPIPHRHKDDRGLFWRTYEPVNGFALAEENQSTSARGAIRGLHWQEPQQTKLVRVVIGLGGILDVCVNIKTHAVRTFQMTPGSGTLYVPKGWAHGFLSLDDTIVIYKVDVPFAPDAQYGFNPFDPKLGIEWPIDPDDAIMSEKDENARLIDG